MQIALEAGRRLGDHKDRPFQTRPRAVCSMYRLANGDDGVLGRRFLALTRCA